MLTQVEEAVRRTVRVSPRELWERTALIRCARRQKKRASEFGNDNLTEKEVLALLPMDEDEMDRKRAGRRKR